MEMYLKIKTRLTSNVLEIHIPDLDFRERDQVLEEFTDIDEICTVDMNLEIEVEELEEDLEKVEERLDVLDDEVKEIEVEGEN